MASDVLITKEDISIMKRALRLASKAIGMTSPNPMVGAIIVKDNIIIAEDYHKQSGQLHAEALALIQASKKAKGASLYVTLEPCCHKDKKTPPCVDAIILSGIKRVYAAIKDPNPKVSGKGFEILRQHGIEVIEGICYKEAYSLNEAYCKFITTGLPFVFTKVAMTLDGKIADIYGNSKWISSEQSRKLVYKLRKSADAIITGVGTVLADNPLMTARTTPHIKNPIRVLIDTHLKTPMDFNIFNPDAHTIVAISSETSQNSDIKKKILNLQSKGIEFIKFKGNRIDWHFLLQRLANLKVMSVMIEAGSSLVSSALHSGIVDKVVFIIAPKIMGGRQSLTAVGGKEYRLINNTIAIKNLTSRKVGQDIWLEGYIDK